MHIDENMRSLQPSQHLCHPSEGELRHTAVCATWLSVAAETVRLHDAEPADMLQCSLPVGCILKWQSPVDGGDCSHVDDAAFPLRLHEAGRGLGAQPSAAAVDLQPALVRHLRPTGCGESAAWWECRSARCPEAGMALQQQSQVTLRVGSLPRRSRQSPACLLCPRSWLGWAAE
jgi:hypothetical protein